MFVAKHAQGDIPLLYIPLHSRYFKFEPTDKKDNLKDTVGNFMSYDRFLTEAENPLDPRRGEGRWLVIFDGLDELAMQGRMASELAGQFVKQLGDEMSGLNQRTTRIQVLISGRTLAVQLVRDRIGEFRKEGQALEILSYFDFVPEGERGARGHGGIFHRYVDVDQRGLLKEDQRQQWWQKYGEVSGYRYEAMPKVLRRYDLVEITSQPLLNYLVALSYTRGKLDFAKENNLNAVYHDLLGAVYERGWVKGKQHPSVEGLSPDEFVCVLEEIGLSAWHGDGRTTTVEAIQKNLKNNSEQRDFQKVLEKLKEDAESGVTHLLTAFYFRQSDYQQGTFEFTHKSFGEYLTARRITRGLARIQTEIECRKNDSGSGWDENEALKHWAELCGPTALDEYLLKFLRNEIVWREQQNPDKVAAWQEVLCNLIGFMLRHGMPMHELGLPNYQKMTLQARNAEEALLAALSVCARVTRKLSDIEWPDSRTFGAWLSRLRGANPSLVTNVAVLCLNHLNLSQQGLGMADLSEADLSEADLSEADLSGANLFGAFFGGADLGEAKLNGAIWTDGRVCKEGSIGECIQEDE